MAGKNIHTLFSILITLIFLFDIIISVLYYGSTAIRTNLEYRDQLKKYFKGWFIFDLIAVLPYGLMFDSIPLDLIRMVKVVKVVQLMYTWNHRYFGYSTQLMLSYFIYWLIIYIHWISCGWLAVLGTDSGSSPMINYINSLYWTVTTMTTVGYGDITPVNTAQRLYAVFTMISGFGIFGYFIGNVVSILSRKDPARTHYLENIEKLTVSTRHRKLPFNLQQRVYDYYTYKWKKRLGYDESDFLDGLPDGLRREVAIHFKKDAIASIPIFKEADKDFIEEISLYLKPTVFTPGDRVFKTGDEARNIYFVITGELNVYSKNRTKLLMTLKSGDYFGEIAIILDKPRSATVIAKTYCDLYTLSKSAYEKVVVKFPAISKQIKKQVKLRKKRDKMI